MAIYNLNYGQLDYVLDRSFSPGTEQAIIEAIQSAGIVTPYSGKTGVEVETTSGSYTIPQSAQIFLDTGSNNTITIHDNGAKLIAAGDGSNKVIDQGPGGDTLVGGAGAESLKVTNGRNLLVGGSGENTLAGGAGHDTLIGGGSSLLEAGSGGSTLIGGLSNQYAGNDDEVGGSGWGGPPWAQGSDDSGRGGGSPWGQGSSNSRWGGGPPGGQGNGWGGGSPWQHGSGWGTIPSDTLMGGQGSDLLQVSHGDNLLIAGSGQDTIFGGDGKDTILGGGHDTINLNYGNEFVQGGSGSDVVNIGLHGNDVIYGGAATTVYTDQTSSSIKSEVGVHGVTTIAFSNHQILTVSNVTIEFADGQKTTIH